MPDCVLYSEAQKASERLTEHEISDEYSSR